MKFIVSSSVLLKSLSILSGVIAANPIVPILDNFLFVIEDNVLTATASDLQTTITTQIQVDSADKLSICVPSRLLLDTLKALPEQPITVNVDTDQWNIELLTDNGKFKMVGENPVDFPKTAVVTSKGAVVMSSDALLSALGMTLFAVSSDDLRPAMTGVFMNMTADCATFAATDGHRLIRYRRTDIRSAEGIVVYNPQTSTDMAGFCPILPKKAGLLLKDSLRSGVEVTAEFSKSNAHFTYGTTKLVCRLIDERYSDFENAIPVNNDKILTIGRSDILNALKRITIYANRTTHQVRFTLRSNKLAISAEDLDYSNEANENLLCDYEGDPMEIGFNAKLMIEMLNNLSAKMIKLEMSAPNRAGLIIPIDREDVEDITMLAMPIMLNTYA